MAGYPTEYFPILGPKNLEENQFYVLQKRLSMDVKAPKLLCVRSGSWASKSKAAANTADNDA